MRSKEAAIGICGLFQWYMSRHRNYHYRLTVSELRDSYEPKLQFNVFTKLVGERWQALDPTEKEHRELIAQQQKETYHKTLAEYKKTPEYAAHHAYVTGWKLKDRQTKAGAIDGKHVPIDGKRRRIDDAAYDGTSLANDDYDDDDEDDDFDDNRPPDRLSALSSPKMTSTTVRGPVFQDRYGARSPLPSESQQHTKVLYTQERASIIDGNSLVRSPRDPRPVAAEPSVYNQSSMRLPSFRPINRHDNEDFFDARARNTYHQPTDPRPSHDLETRLERTRSAMVDGRPPESWAKQPFTLPPLERHMSHPSPSNLFLPPPSGLTTEKMQDGIPQSAARDQVSASVSASTYALGNAARRPSMLVEATSSSSAISALSALSARSGYQPSAADGRGPPAFREKNAVSDHYEPTGPSTAFRPLSPVDGRVDGIHSAYHHTRESNGRSPSSASRRMSSRSDLADSV